MRILVNDFLSDPVPSLRGVRHGDCLSPVLYVLSVEVSYPVGLETPPRLKAFFFLGPL